VANYCTNEKHINISISDCNKERATLSKLDSRVDSLFCAFADNDRIGFDKSEGELFNKHVAETIWKFVDKYKDEVDLIVINCEAGISRSSAVGAAISKVINGSDEDFFKYFIPNRLVYRKMMEVKSWVGQIEFY